MKDIVSHYGNPDQLVSDNGPQFVSQEFAQFLKDRNIKHIKSAVYNPQQNGFVEVFNRSVKFGAQVIFAEGNAFAQGREFVGAYNPWRRRDQPIRTTPRMAYADGSPSSSSIIL